MTRSWMTSRRRCAVWHALAAGLAVWSPASAQPVFTDLPVNLQERYGDPKAQDRDRRPLPVYQNPWQQSFLSVYQETGRRSEGRDPWLSGGLLPQDLFGFRAARPRASTIDPLASPDWLPQRRRLFERFGGFERRIPVGEAGEVQAAFARRYGLVEATAFAAPVYRALARPTTGVGPLPRIEQTPFLPASDAEPALSGVTLVQELRREADLAHQKARADGWAWFREGRYRQAARSFESARVLEKADLDSAIGEVVSYFSVGALRTSAAVVRNLALESANPFVPDVNLSARFASVDEFRRVRTEVQLLAKAAETNPDIAALQVLLLWCLNERAEASVAAAALARHHPGSPFAAWLSGISELVHPSTGRTNPSP